MYQLYIKRLVDILLSFLGLIMLMPLLLIIAVMIKLDSKGPVLFKQTRIGRNKTSFCILKFRTMRNETPKDIPTHLMTQPEEYITRAGFLLRKTSLDELPQLWNILVGHMSIVGPRPALWNQYDLIEARDKYGANHIRPGLTGWAQINGRDAIEIEEKARFDGDYAKRIRPRMDCTCFIGSISVVLRREGFIEGGTGLLSLQKDLLGAKVAEHK